MAKGEKKFPEKDYDWEIVKALAGREGSSYSISGDAKDKITEIPQSTILRILPKLEAQGLITKVGIGKRNKKIYTANLYGLLMGYKIKNIENQKRKIDKDELINIIKRCCEYAEKFKEIDVFLPLFDISECKMYFFYRLNDVPLIYTEKKSSFLTEVTLIADSFAAHLIESFMTSYFIFGTKIEKLYNDNIIFLNLKEFFPFVDFKEITKNKKKRSISIGKELGERIQQREKKFKKEIRKTFNSKHKKEILKENLTTYLKMEEERIKVFKENYNIKKEAGKELMIYCG